MTKTLITGSNFKATGYHLKLIWKLAFLLS